MSLREQGLLREPDAGALRSSEGSGGEPSESAGEELGGAEGQAWPESWRLDARTNHYQGLGGAAVSRETLATLSHSGAGAGASRLIYGTKPEHLRAEHALSTWLQTEASLLFSSGYAANVGTLQALAGPDDLIVSDALNHASIIDGCRLSRATVRVVPHLDLAAAERALSAGAHRQRFLVTESYFSMDGDSPDLGALRRICDRNDAALIVDEAHALGVFGPAGRGLCAAANVVPDVLVGTLGKALGLHGAFVAGSALLRTWLWNRARSFVFSTAPSPLLVALVPERVGTAAAADAPRQRLAAHAQQLRDRLRSAGLNVPEHSHGPIVPVLVGDPARALAARDALAQRGVRAQAIRPPTVPPGTARLRLTVRADLAAADLGFLADATIAALAT